MKLFSVFILFLICGSRTLHADLGLDVQTRLKGSRCDIWKDPQGVPHLRAKDEIGGIACLGYIHGRDRAWEMDYFRKTVQGRKAEFLGKDHIRSDFFLRLLGLQERADAVFKEMSAQTQTVFFAYAQGVNRGMKEALEKGIYEFDQLGYRPDPWRPEDTLGLYFLQSFDQTKRGFQSQINETQWAKEHGREAAALFRVQGLPWDVSILKAGEYPRASPTLPSLSPSQGREVSQAAAALQTTPTEMKSLLDFPSQFGGPGMGSNNWVIGAQRSQTGHAWLANDPHLTLGYPPFWFWVHLNAGDLDVIGATLPGVPLIGSGANRHVSWGLTNSFLPVSRVSYIPEEDLSHAQSTRPVIWVRFWKFKLPYFFSSFRRTASQLPILPLPGPPGKAMVLNWTGFALKPNDFMGLYQTMSARSVQEADRSLSQMRVPSWNYVFADDQGGIGYRAIGRVARFDHLPQLGIPLESLAAVESSPAFQRPLTAEEMPHLLNPKRGFVVTANNSQWPQDSLLSSGGAQIQGFRAFRIEELIRAKPRHDFTSLQEIQCDNQAVDARFILPPLLKILEARWKDLPRAEQFLPVLASLKAWDLKTHVHCTACGVYRRWVSRILDQKELNLGALYRKLIPGPTSGDELFQKDILNLFQLALNDLKWNQTHQLPKWGEIHKNSFPHLAAHELSPTHPVGTPGDDQSVSPGTSQWTGEFLNQTEGASQRLIVKMTSPPEVYSVLAGSNQDLEVRNLLDPESEWQKWIQCRQQRRFFPVDWTQVEDSLQPVVF